MKTLRSTIVYVMIVILILMTGCGAKSSIIGTWEGDLNTLTFNSDGTMITSIFGIGTDGTYEFTDDDTIVISQFGISTTYNVTIKKDLLFLENGGITLSYSKAK